MSMGRDKVIMAPYRLSPETDRDLRRVRQSPRSHVDVQAERRNRAARYRARLR